MRTNPGLLALLAASSLAIAGCKTGDSTGSSSSDSASTSEEVASAKTRTEPEPSAVAPALQDAQGDVRQQRDTVVFDGLLSEAKAHLENSDLQAARELLLQAYELQPSNVEVQNLLDRVAIQLGEHSAAIGEVSRSAMQMEEVRRQQARLEVETKVTEADRAAEAGDLDGAIRSLEDAALVLRWNPYITSGADDMGLTEENLRGRIAELRGRRDAEARALREEQERRALAERQEAEREERNRLQNTIERLLRQANDSFYVERYKESIAYCEQVLDLDPDHEEADSLKNIAADAMHASLEQQYSSDFKYHWREVFDELELDMRPVTETLSFPGADDWDRISRRGPIRFSLEQEAIPAEDQRIWTGLETQTIQLDFEDTALEDAIQFFRVNTGINFIIDPIVLDTADVTFDVSLPSMTVKKALELLMDLSTEAIGYRVQSGVVRIVSTEEASGGQTLEFYDVRDLTKEIASFPSKDYHLKPSNAFEDFEDDEIEPAPIVLDQDSLIELIQTNIGGESWDIDPNNTIDLISGALVVKQTPDVHRQIDKLLSDLRSNAGTLINIETRFLSLEDRFLEDIGVDFRGLDGQNGAPSAATVPNVVLDDFGTPGSGGVGTPGFPEGIGTGNDAGAFFTEGGDLDLRGRVENLYDLTLGDREFQATGGANIEFTYLDDTLVEAVLRAVQKSKLSQIVTANNLTVFNGQRAHITVQDHITYVKDFEVEIAQGAVIADPIVDVIRDGTILDVRPVVSSDRRFVTMEVRPTVMDLQEPIPLFRTSLAIGNEVELQLPELRIQRVRTTVTIPDGATLVLGGLKELTDASFSSGLPFLRDIPVVSFLFGRKGTERTRKKNLILVRAEIVIPEETEPRRSP